MEFSSGVGIFFFGVIYSLKSGMDFHVVQGDWAAMMGDARLVREEVFVQEQKVPLEDEWDDLDDVCLHAVAYDKETGDAVGTVRLLPDGHIGRLAVRKPGRGAGVGGALLKHMMQEAKARGQGEVVLSAQIQAERFYIRHGFVREGEEFMDAGIPHIQMRHVFAT